MKNRRNITSIVLTGILLGFSVIVLTGILLGFSVQAWAYSGDTIQDDIAREFNGATSYTIPLSAPTQSVPTTPPANNCEATLQQEMGDGQIPTDEQCDCPVGATQPVCTALPASDCPNLLQIEENRLGSDAQYEDCTCPTGASTPQCTSYYQLCEAALPNYQNSTNECTCSQTATSAVPACTSDYSICEKKLPQYNNANQRCICDQTSETPECSPICKFTEEEATSFNTEWSCSGSVINGTLYYSCFDNANSVTPSYTFSGQLYKNSCYAWYVPWHSCSSWTNTYKSTEGWPNANNGPCGISGAPSCDYNYNPYGNYGGESFSAGNAYCPSDQGSVYGEAINDVCWNGTSLFFTAANSQTLEYSTECQ